MLIWWMDAGRPERSWCCLFLSVSLWLALFSSLQELTCPSCTRLQCLLPWWSFILGKYLQTLSREETFVPWALSTKELPGKWLGGGGVVWAGKQGARSMWDPGSHRPPFHHSAMRIWASMLSSWLKFLGEKDVLIFLGISSPFPAA